MKKLLAILLSVLMLCSVIPFAAVSVSAEEGINIVVEVSDEQVNAGDEFEVTVLLEGNPGLISADITITYDTDAIELLGEWDGSDFYPEIESPRKWKANGFTYGPDETRCTVIFTLGTSSNITEEEYFTAIFVAKEDAYTGDYDLTVSYDPNNYFGRGEKDGEFIKVPVLGVENGSIAINGRDPEPPTCEHEYDDDCDADCNLCGETREVEHAIVYAEAVAPTCTDEGNIEYWCCDICGAAWLDEALTQSTDLTAVMLPVDEQAHTYLYDCDKYCNNCGEKTRPGAKHNVTHVEAKEAVSCVESGNVEYWHCDACGVAWLDEDGHYQTNMMSVKTYGPCISDSPACVDGTCINCGLPCLAEAEHAYDDEYDADCNECGDIREVPERPFVYGDLNNDGDITNRDLALIQQFINGWDVEIVNEAADVNGDGEITNRDQALLQQFINGWDVVLGQS